MQNREAERFVKNLFAACPDYRASKETREDAIRIYLDKLAKWRLTAGAWSRALSLIVAENLEGTLPTLAVIYTYLKSSQEQSSAPSAGIHLAFTLDGHRYVHSYDTGKVDRRGDAVIALTAVDPASLPKLPAGATDVRLIIPSHKEVPIETAERMEARGAFLRGWLGSGADGDKCMAMFETLKAA